MSPGSRARFHFQLTCSTLILFIPVISMPALEPEEIEFFESKIRPVLAQECYECHQTGGKNKGGLVLDHREALLKGGESGELVKAGDPEASLLIRAIRHDVEDLEMPKNGAQLEDSVIADFEKWIRMGAPDPRDNPPSESELAMDTDWPAVRERRKNWWSFQPIQNQEPPLPQKGESAHPVDRYIATELREQGLVPSSRAGREVLIRRLSFNLRGLPPSPEEIEAFMADESPEAYEALVDSYIASPRFGERWARHWMDWLRYADSHGSEGDPMIPNAWRYRDYLIRALNEDVSYDQLVMEHLAGDLLDSPRINESLALNESAIGPAHLRMVFHGFAPTDPLDEQVRFTDDQINVVSKAFMGLTVSCARCHNHKFDPISQADFYAWYGVMVSGRPAMIRADVPPVSEKETRAKMNDVKNEIQAQMLAAWLDASDAVESGIVGPAEKLVESLKNGEKDNFLWPIALLKKNPEKFAERWRDEVRRMEDVGNVLSDDQVRARWDFSDAQTLNDWFTDGPRVRDTVGAGEISIRLEGDAVIADILPAGVYSHLDSTKDIGVLHSRSIELDAKYDLWVRVAGSDRAMARYAVQNYPRDGTVFPVENLQDGRWRWKKFPLGYWEGDKIHFEMTTAADQGLLARTDATRSWFGIQEALIVREDAKFDPSRNEDVLNPVYRKFGERVPETIEDLAAAYHGVVADALASWKDKRLSNEQAVFLNAAVKRELLPNSLKNLGNGQSLVVKYRELESKIATPKRVPGQFETVGHDQPLFERGNHKQPLNPVPRRFLEALDDTPYESDISGRLEFANDFLRVDNPLTSRVIVNRVWNHLFGRGLVATPDNFGRMGRKPSHPELLDHLAAEFRENGWSIKTLIRELVLSETWCRESEASPAAIAQDPENVYLSHYPIRRLEAEAIRDSILAVSGQLDSKTMYGKPVLGKESRRSVYVRVKRNNLDPFLTQFDAPVPASTKGKRDDTNVPGQSLTLLNDRFVMDAAKKWAEAIREEGEEFGDSEKIGQMFVRSIGRMPTLEESIQAEQFMAHMDSGRHESTVRVRELKIALEAGQERIAALESAGVKRVRASRSTDGDDEPGSDLPTPIASWDFSKSVADEFGGLHGELRGSAVIENGALVLDGKQSYAATAPLKKALRSKTLEAWVKLDDLNQQGGGVISIQTMDGGVFDAIVIGEQERGRWIAGSDNFRRTQSLGGLPEQQADKEFVHVAVTYSEDGRISFYRAGKLYGESYQKSKPVLFKAGESQVLFGNRHGTPSGGRLLEGEIAKARLYDRALNEREIQASASNDPNFVNAAEQWAALSRKEQSEMSRLREETTELRTMLKLLESAPGFSSQWADLGHALFNLKEFIYVR